MLRRLVFAALVVCPGIALAQPGEPPPDPAGAQPAQAQPPPAGVDDAKIREIVDRELARVLTERAAKEAAEKAAREQAEREQTPDKPGDLTGSSGFMDTRLAFTLTNENMLARPGETIPSVPGFRFGVPNSLGVLFFDNYDTKYSGFETLTHATMYRSFSRGHLQAEAAVVLRFNELTESVIPLSDAGTYITVTNWKDPTHKDPTRISLTAFPVSADRFRLGYSYRLSWGGNPEYQRGARARSATPGVKLQYDTENMYAFIGAKSAVLVDPNDGEQKSALAALAGAGIDPNPSLRLEVNGGFFDRGYNDVVDVQDQKIQMFGASAQATIHKGMPIRSSVDYRLYKFNGEQVSQLFSPEKYPGGLAWVVSAEATMIGQTLKDPERTGSTKIQYGRAGDVNVRVKLDRVRLRADLSYRDLAFILHKQAGIPAGSDFPDVYTTQSDLFAAVGADKNWSDFLTLGAIVGVERPATLTSPKGIPGAIAAGMGTSTAVIRDNNIDPPLITILPAGEAAVPQFAVKGTAKVDFAKIFSTVLEVFYSYDGNQTRYVRACDDPEQCPFEYQFGQFNQLGVNLTLQARF